MAYACVVRCMPPYPYFFGQYACIYILKSKMKLGVCELMCTFPILESFHSLWMCLRLLHADSDLYRYVLLGTSTKLVGGVNRGRNCVLLATFGGVLCARLS